ncbi:MAG TPA: ATP-binding protein [Ktedonobacterales bacterium]|nr:ATP-binding protein [Ktedonobacterales bacterium]
MPTTVSSPTTARPRLIILCGLPGSGKTTFARRMESALPIVRLCPDDWMADLGINHDDRLTHDRLEEWLSQLALSLLGLGQSVTLEYGFWGRSERDQKRAEAHAIGVPIDLYYFNPPLDELWQRLLARNERGTHGTVMISRANLERSAGIFPAPDDAECALFDRAVLVADARTFPLCPS